MSFGATCSPSIEQFVKNVNAEEHSAQYPEAAKSIKRNTYVDDWLASRWSTEELMSLTNDVVAVNSKAGFAMRKWYTNDPDLAPFLDSEEEGWTSLTDTKLLGMNWSAEFDEFTFTIDPKLLDNYNTYESRPTKLEVLIWLMSIFDPLGKISYITIAVKLLRELWRRRVDWHEQIPDDLVSMWQTWVKSLQQVQKMRIPRWFGTAQRPVELHVFADASERAMAAAVYVVQHGPQGAISSLVLSKTRVAPLNNHSIPRQELQAYLMGVRLLDLVKKALDLPIEWSFIWTRCVVLVNEY